MLTDYKRNAAAEATAAAETVITADACTVAESDFAAEDDAVILVELIPVADEIAAKIVAELLPSTIVLKAVGVRTSTSGTKVVWTESVLEAINEMPLELDEDNDCDEITGVDTKKPFNAMETPEIHAACSVVLS